ncbi:MAG: hypothetical protein RDU24_12430 [Humidesulfovibrio sp.]|nr:hypothetical protein [Humidesulfovibrio sp.]
MKRVFPPLFLGCALLANLIHRSGYVAFLETWTPGSRYSGSQPLALFAFFGIPAGILLLWIAWKPSTERLAGLAASRRWLGNIILGATILVWLRYIYLGMFAGWVAATPVEHPLEWLKYSHKMFTYASLTLPIGGLTALWLKGIHVPQRKVGKDN